MREDPAGARTSPPAASPRMSTWLNEEDYCTAIHEAAHAVAADWTGAGRVRSVEIGLRRTRPDGVLLGRVRFEWGYRGNEAALIAVEAGRPLLLARLVVCVAAPLAVARVMGEGDMSWIGYVEAHRRSDLDALVPAADQSENGISDYVKAQRLCTLLGLTLAEGMALGEAVLDEPGVMEAVYRVAWAVLDTRPDYRLDRDDFLAALQLPATVQGRYEVVHESARRALARRLQPQVSEDERSDGRVAFAVMWILIWFLRYLLQASYQ